jgi:hypothetical protein
LGDVINLRRARKTKLRADKAAQASENRAKFGRPMNELKLQDALDNQERKALDAHLLSSRDDSLK